MLRPFRRARFVSASQPARRRSSSAAIAIVDALERRTLLSAFAAGVAANAGPYQQIPDGGIDLTDRDGVAQLSLNDSGNRAMRTVVPVSDASLPFDEAVRIEVNEAAPNPWNVQLRTDTTGALHTGDTVFVTMFVRGLAADGGRTDLRAYLELNGAPYTKSVTIDIEVDIEVDSATEWTQIMVPFAMPHDRGANQHVFVIHAGSQPQTFEIGGLQVLNYNSLFSVDDLPVTGDVGKDVSWQAAANARIDAYRKADFDFTLVDANGRAVDDAEVRIEQVRHEFGFGNIVQARWLGITRAEFDALPDADWARPAGMTWDDVLQYRQIVEDNYNKVVFENDLKWGAWEDGKSPTNPVFRHEWIDRAIAWADARGIEVRGHLGAWGHISGESDWNHNRDTSAGLDQRTLDHIAEKVTAIGDRVTEWDAMNHPIGWSGFSNTTESRYGSDHHADLFRAVAAAAPNAEMWVNEDQLLPSGRNIDAYTAYIQRMIDRNAPLDGIGFQGHFRSVASNSARPVEDLYQTMEHFASIIPNLQITELDYETEDAAAQAEYIADVLRMSFSHEAMKAVVQWGFWSELHWRPLAAHYEADWTIRPVGQAVEDLVFGEWWTDQTLDTTNGRVSTRGFQGDYRITVSRNGQSQTFERSLGDAGLSDRLTLASNEVLASVVDGELRIAGTEAADDLRIYRVGHDVAGDTYRVSSRSGLADEWAGSGRRVMTISGVTAGVRIDTGGGNDRIRVQDRIGQAAAGPIAIDSGDGNDAVSIVGFVGDGLSVQSGSGDDRMYVSRSSFTADATVDSGAGVDRVYLHRSQFDGTLDLVDAAGSTTVRLVDTSVAAATSIDVGDALVGQQRVSVIGGSFDASLAAESDAGNAFIGLHAATIAGDLTIGGQGGRDRTLLRSVTIGGSATIALGDGENGIVARDVTVGQAFHLAGGSGTDRARLYTVAARSATLQLRGGLNEGRLFGIAITEPADNRVRVFADGNDRITRDGRGLDDEEAFEVIR